ncbi:MAG: MFS transporter [Caldilineales bacterium]|nr:MFS transporter [Caldilineales bacterium]
MSATTTTAAVNITGIKRRQTASYFVSYVGIGLVASIMGPTLQFLATGTGVGLSQISIIFTTQALGWMLGSYIAGRRFDRSPAHPYIAVLVLVMAVLVAATPVIPVLVLLAAAMFVIGYAGGAVDVGGNTLLMWVHGDEVDARMNALHFFFGVGALIAPSLVAQSIARTEHVVWAYWIVAGFLIIPGLLFARTPSPANPYVAHPEQAANPRWVLVGLIAAMFFLFVGAELSFGGWIYTYAVTLDLATLTTAGYLTSVFWGALTLGRLIAIPLAPRFRARTILIFDIIGLLISLGALLFLPPTPTLLWAATFGMGLFMASVFPTLMLLAEHHLPVTGQIISIFLVAASLGSMSVPWLIGQFFESYGASITIISIFTAIVLSAVTLAIFVILIRGDSSPRRLTSQRNP